MSEDEERMFIKQQQLEERIIKLAELEAHKFADNSRYSLDIITLHEAYKRGYSNALLDILFINHLMKFEKEEAHD
jgi:hypothetical protein